MEEKRRKPKFKRTESHKYSKLGVRRKSKQKYRKGKGIDNKMRLNKRGRTKKVKIGFRSPRKTRGLIDGLKPVMVFNIEDIQKIKKSEIGVLGKIGMKKKYEVAKHILENKIKLSNLNPEKLIKKVEEVLKERKDKKSKLEKKSKAREKKVKEVEKKEAEEKKKEEEKKDDKSVKAEKKEGIEDIVEEKTKEEKTKEKPSSSDKSDEASKNTAKAVQSKEKNTKKDIQTNNYGRGK